MSLFDIPKLHLNPDIWETDGQHLRPEVTPYMVQLLECIFPMTKVSSMVMIGSSVGHQYSDTSDIDINISATKGEEFDTWHKIFKKFNDTPNYYPGTQHPINFFFQEYTSSNDWSNSLGAYDMLQSMWAKRPVPFDKIGDPQERFRSEIQYAKMLLNLIDKEVESMEATAARGQTEETEQRLLGLAIMFKNIEDNRKAAYRYRAGTPALQEYNAVYKMIEGSRHHDLFKRLINLYDSEWKVA